MPSEHSYDHPGGDRGDHQDLFGYLSALWRLKWVILIIALVGTLAAVGVSLTQATSYSASTRVLVTPIALNPAGSVPLASTISLPTEAEIVRSEAVSKLAAEQVGGSASDVREHTSATYVPDTQVLVISYSSPNADDAAAGATAVADSYLENRSAQAMQAAEEAFADGSTRVAELRAQAQEAAKEAAQAPEGSPERIEAEQQAQELTAQAAIWENNIAMLNTEDLSGGEVLVAASVPSKPSSPDHVKAALRGLVLGLIIGIAAALTIDATHRRRRRT